MGGCISAQDRAEEVNSQPVSCELIVPSDKEHKVLLIGSGDSGKSTITKQMKIIHQNGFTDEDLEAYRQTIYRNTLDSAQAIVLAMRKFGYDYVNLANHVNAERILEYRVDPSPSFVFSFQIAQAIHALWNDAVIPKLLERASQFYLMGNAPYFFTDVLRIGSPTYRPTKTDVLHAYLETRGANALRFTMGELRILLLDGGGQRSERRAWIHCSHDVSSIIFCVALSEYHEVLAEDNSQNRMIESLSLFESLVQSWSFISTPVVVFLNKLDVFKNTLRKIPLERYFPEYLGGANVDKAAKFIVWKYKQVIGRRSRQAPVYFYLTQATNTAHIRWILEVVKGKITTQ